MAFLAEAREDYAEMAELFEQADAGRTDFYILYFLGRAHRLNSNIEDAVTTLSRAVTYIDAADHLALFPFNILVHYELGLAYEASGWNQKAADSYTKFLDIWKGADFESAEMADAGERLARLSATP